MDKYFYKNRILMAEQTLRNKVIEQIRQTLGYPKIQVELTLEQYNLAVDKSISKYRALASNSTEEAYTFLQLKTDKNVYFLPPETIEVRKVFRRGIGGRVGAGTQLDPFSLAFTNAYILQLGQQGDLLTYELYSDYLKTLGRMFGANINFSFHRPTKKFTIMQAVRQDEEVLLWVYLQTPEEVLLSDTFAYPWMRDWALAECKEILGEIRSKFSNIPGPSGGVSLNGESLKTAAESEKQALLKQLDNYEDGSRPYGFFFG